MEKPNGKGKAVAKAEEASPLTSEETIPFAIPLVKEELNDAGSHVLGHQEEGSSSAAPPPPPPPPAPPAPAAVQAAEWAPAVGAAVLALAAPGLALPPSPQLHFSRIRLIKEVMQQCVTAIASGNIMAANAALANMSNFASHDGDPLQRVASVFSEALGRRALQMLPGLAAGLGLQTSQQPAPAPPYAGATRICFDAVCPFLRVAAAISNRAILKAMQGEEHVHVVDLGGANLNQWRDLLRLFAARPEGAPASLRLTVVNKGQGFLACSALLLNQEAARLHIPFTYNPVKGDIDNLAAPVIASFGVVRGEALAITSTLQLHRLIADPKIIELPVGPSRHGRKGRAKKVKQQITRADAVLRVLCDKVPKLMLITEQEADHNGASLGDRVRNAFDYYAAIFNDVEAGGAARNSPYRSVVERLLLRGEVMDIVIREGPARRERHESTLHWAKRMVVAGFKPARVMSFDAMADPALQALQFAPNGGALRYWLIGDATSYTIYSGMTSMFSVTAWEAAVDRTAP